MTAILLATPYYPPNLGGVQQYVWNLARQLRKRHDWRVVVVTTAEPGVAYRREVDADGVTVHRLPSLRRISNTPVGTGWTGAIRRIIRDEKIDLVNAHGPVPLFADLARRAAGDVPFVLTYHAGRMRKGSLAPDLVLATYEGMLLASTVRRSQELICASEHVGDDLPKLFSGRQTVIEPGADLDLFRRTPVPPEQRIVFSASLEKATAYKGLADLLHAVARLAPSLPDVHLEVAGSGTAEQDYHELARRLGISERVTFAGYLSGERLAEAYRRARVLCLPTHFDNYPTVIVEAMATGRPIVATRVGAIPMFVSEGGSGLLNEPGDIDALTGSLRTVLTDYDLAARLGATGADFVAANLSWQHQSDRHVAVFQRAMAGGRTVSRTEASRQG
ncbi:glycosyltransferase family 4 protein [Actinoplanes sp. L3-i22]|uniref:glycosyltransferase family 4 protein n=1 Tax=Actinoplanes sp. L3-i22 TaxID=2836373 RepID=UPI001C866683|nr:glycosyltransferase family 4 protein [Actinoplanes sp. L3-i22]